MTNVVSMRRKARGNAFGQRPYRPPHQINPHTVAKRYSGVDGQRAAAPFQAELARKSPQRYVRLLLPILKRNSASLVVESSEGAPLSVEVILSSAAMCGFNGRGKGGLAGFLQALAQRHPSTYRELLLGVLKKECRALLLALKERCKKIEAERREGTFDSKRLLREAEGRPDGKFHAEADQGFALAEAVCLAAVKVGFDGRGKAGLRGYLLGLAAKHNVTQFMFPILDYEVGAEKTTAIFNSSRRVTYLDQFFQISAMSVSIYKKIDAFWIAEEDRIRRLLSMRLSEIPTPVLDSFYQAAAYLGTHGRYEFVRTKRQKKTAGRLVWRVDMIP